MLLPQSVRHQEAPQRVLTIYLGLNFPFKTRRASQERARKAKCVFERSELCWARPFREAQGSPQGRVLWAFSFGYFSCTHKKSDKVIQNNNKLLQGSHRKRRKITSPRIDETYPDPTSKVAGLGRI